jgi:hypothetical protein
MRGDKHISGIVSAIATGPTSINNTIPAGGMVLSVRGTPEATFLANTSIGDRIRVRIDTTAGAFNNANMAGAALANVIQGAVTPGATGVWAGAATDAQIVADFRLAIDTVKAGSIYRPDTVVVGPLEMGRLLQPTTAAGYTPNLKTILEDSWNIEIFESERLRAIPAADAAGGVAVARAVFFEKSLEVFNPLLTVGPEQYPPKQMDTGYEVTVHQRLGGVESTNPLGGVYFDMS